MEKNTEANYYYKDGKIIEKATGYVIRLTKDKAYGIKLVNWLNAGGGFDGWTPKFFVREENEHIST